MKIILFCFLLFSFRSNAQKTVSVSPGFPVNNPDSLKKEMQEARADNRARGVKTQLRYFIIKAPENTFGYDIYANGNLYLHQNTVPGMSGNKGFTDTTGAGKVARFVIKKIRQGEIPPTITRRELQKLKVSGIR